MSDDPLTDEQLQILAEAFDIDLDEPNAPIITTEADNANPTARRLPE